MTIVEDGKAVKYRVQIGRSEGTNIQVIGRRRATATAGDWLPFNFEFDNIFCLDSSHKACLTTTLHKHIICF